MQGSIRRKLSMVERALAFAGGHPATDPGQQAILARLVNRRDRAATLAVQERSGQVGERAAVARRNELRRAMHMQLLRHVGRVAEIAAEKYPEVGGQFLLPSSNWPTRAFLTAATAMLAAAQKHEARLLEFGLGATFIPSLTAALGEFAAASEVVYTGRHAHVGARADLKAVTNECVALVGVLDGLVRVQYADAPDTLAEWQSARTVYDDTGVRGPRTPVADAAVVETIVPPIGSA
jgi:hypothetical protein